MFNKNHKKVVNNEYFERIERIYNSASKYLESFFTHNKYYSVFNSHGFIHTNDVINNYFKIKEKLDFEINEYEEAILVSAIIMHDIGMTPVKYNDSMELHKFKHIRKNHAERVAWWILSGQIETNWEIEFDFAERIYLAVLTLHHGPKYCFKKFPYAGIQALKKKVLDEEIDNFVKKMPKEEVEKIFDETENFLKNKATIDLDNLKSLGAILSLSDKMDYGKSRIPMNIVKVSNFRSLRDDFEYLVNEVFEDYEVNKQEEKITVKIKGYDKIENNFEDLFEEFKAELIRNDGQITEKSYFLAALQLENTIQKKWNNMQYGLVHNPKFNKIKKLEFIPYEGDYKKYSIVDEDSIAKINSLLSDDIDKLNIFEKQLLANIIFENTSNLDNIDLELINYNEITQIKVFAIQQEKNVFADTFYKANKYILKIGDFGKLHKENFNYSKYAIPLIEKNSLIGFTQEYKFLDYAAFISYLSEEQPSNLGNSINYESTHDIVNHIGNSLKIFYDKIKPVRSKDDSYLNKNFKAAKKILNSHSNESLVQLEDLEIQMKKASYKPFISLTHGDFTFKNMLLSEDDIVFIDFDSTDICLFHRDFAKLEHYILFNKLIGKNDKDSVIKQYLGKNNKETSLSIKLQRIELAIKEFILSKLDLETNSVENYMKELNLARYFVNIQQLDSDESLLEKKDRIHIINSLGQNLLENFKQH